MSKLLSGPFLLRAYWGARVETVDACAERLAGCLGDLADISEVFDGWFRKGGSKSAASRQSVGQTVGEMRQLLLAGKQRRDVDGGVMDELGFSVSLWNRRSPAVAWSLTCGASPAAGVGVLNHFVIDWPERAAGDASLVKDAQTARNVMLSVVRSWEPDWATWTSDALRDAQQAEPRQPVLGLLTYLSESRLVPSLEMPETTVERVGSGHLITLEPAERDVSSRLSGLREALSRTGALRPTS